MPFAGISERFVTGSPEIAPDGLVLAYDMRTVTRAGRMQDFSGRGSEGRIVGTEPVPGPFGSARAFRDASDFVGLPFRRNLHLRGPVSIAVWVRFNRMGVHQHIVSYDDLYTLWVDEDDRFRFSDTRGNAFESEGGIVPVGAWTALVATFEGRPGTPLDDRNIALYVNGRRTPGCTFGVWRPGRAVEGYLGKESHDGQFYLPFLGEIAAVLIFRRPLSAHEAEAFATAPRVPERLPSSPSTITDPQWLPPPVRRIVRPPRVVRISSILAPYRVPTLQILQASRWLRFEQWVMAASERNRNWDLTPSSPPVRIFRDWGIDLSHRDMATAHFNPGVMWELSTRPPDFVILGGYEQPTCLSAGLILERLGIPFLISSESISLRDSLVGRHTPFLVQKLVRRSAGIIVPGRASREHFLSLGVAEDRIFVAPNAIDVRRFPPAASPAEKKEARASLGLPVEGTLCLSIGRLTPTKGVMELLDAFHALRPGARGLRLVMVGQGRLREEVESRIARDQALRGNVSVVGYVPEALLPRYYAAADVFVFPTRRDIWGLVLNEAMCAGLPVVSTNAAAATLDLIEDGVDGIVVPSERPDALAAGVLRLHENPGLRERMGARARQRILGGFTPRHQAEGFLEAIETTLRRLGRLPRDLRALDGAPAGEPLAVAGAVGS